MKIFPGLKLSDTIISLIGAVSLFVIPMNMKTGAFVLEWKDTEKLAWGILILFGGGLSLAKGMASSGVVDVITDSIQNSGFNPFIVISLLIVLMLFMTELMSNVALVCSFSTSNCRNCNWFWCTVIVCFNSRNNGI